MAASASLARTASIALAIAPRAVATRNAATHGLRRQQRQTCAPAGRPPGQDRTPFLKPPQVKGQVNGGGIALAGSFSRHLRQIVSKVARYARPQLARPHDLGRDHQLQGLDRRLTQKWWATRQGLVQHRTQSVDISGRTDLFRSPFRLFGCHVRGGAKNLPRERLPGVGFQQFGQAEVADLGAAVLHQEHVAGLQVAMHDTGNMSCLYGRCQLFEKQGGSMAAIGPSAMKRPRLPRSAYSIEK